MRVTKIPAKKLDIITKKKVAAYARVSTASEAQLLSLSAQIDYYKKQITSRSDWEFAGVFISTLQLRKRNSSKTLDKSLLIKYISNI